MRESAISRGAFSLSFCCFRLCSRATASNRVAGVRSSTSSVVGRICFDGENTRLFAFVSLATAPSSFTGVAPSAIDEASRATESTARTRARAARSSAVRGSPSCGIGGGGAVLGRGRCCSSSGERRALYRLRAALAAVPRGILASATAAAVKSTTNDSNGTCGRPSDGSGTVSKVVCALWCRCSNMP